MQWILLVYGMDLIMEPNVQPQRAVMLTEI